MAILHYPYKAFFAGDPNTSKIAEMLDTIPEETEIFVNEEKWLPKLREYFNGRLIQKTRIKMSPKNLSLEKLESLKKPLPEGYSLERVDKETLERLPHILQVHIPPFFGAVDDFMEKGIGFCVKQGDKPISMASSCLPYTDKLEVQIATVDSPEHRRKGFGTAACIALLEHCLKNKIEPHWDAFNEKSALMAEKLGYTDPEQYYVYKWRKDGKVRINRS
jgi:GNAT superfamily N-acetyltransferase